MEATSYYLFWCGLVSAAGSALAYVGYALASRRAYVVGATEAGIVSVAEERPPPATVGALASLLCWTAAGFLGGAVVTRAMAAGRPPYGNMWEFFEAFAFVATIAYAISERWHGQKVAGAFVLPLVAVLLGVSEALFPHRLEPLVPALQNNRLLAIHVASMIIAYGLLTVAAGASVIYLLQSERDRFPRLPSAATAEEITHRLIMAGFPVLGLGIALGAYWGSYAWGRYWGWDPKETTALVSWLVYAGYMHARALRGWSGRRTAMISLLGYGVILFNIFVVNFVISGLHSYAGG